MEEVRFSERNSLHKSDAKINIIMQEDQGPYSKLDLNKVVSDTNRCTHGET